MSHPSVEWSDMIFVNRRGEVLLNLRDNKPDILYPNCWDFVGGAVEPDETPDECLQREVMEETGQKLKDYAKFRVDDITLEEGRLARSHTYYASLEKEASDLILGEGQEHRFFALELLDTIDLVPLTGRILRDFFASSEYQACKEAAARPGI